MEIYKLDLLCGADLLRTKNDFICIDKEIPTIEEIENQCGEIFNIDELIKDSKFIQLDVEKDKLPFSNNSVIEIVSTRGIGRGYIKKYNEIMRVLNPKGKIILYNSYLPILDKLVQWFNNIDIEAMNCYNNENVNKWDFLFTCYNKKS